MFASMQARDEARRSFTRRVREEDRQLSKLSLLLWLLSVFMVAPGATLGEGGAPGQPWAELVTPTVLTVLSSTAAGLPAPLTSNMRGGGILEVVTPVIPAGTQVPRGRIFAECWMVDVVGNPVHSVWRGYLVTSGSTVAGPSSTPGIFIRPGWALKAVATQTDQGAGLTIQFNCSVTPGDFVSDASGYIFNEAPGSGLGELVALTPSAPAAGADYTRFTVPAKCLDSPFAMQAELITSATVANRVARYTYDDGSNRFANIPPATVQAASLDYVYSWGVGLALQGAVASILKPNTPLPSLQMKAGWRHGIVTDGIQAADQWSNGNAQVMRWAVP